MGALKKLNQLTINETGKVKKVGGEENLKKKLLDMGVIPGTLIHVTKMAPLGDPIDIKVRGYHLTLRKEEALQISLEVIEDV